MTRRQPLLSTRDALVLGMAVACFVGSVAVSLWGLLTPVDPWPATVIRPTPVATVPHESWRWPGPGSVGPALVLWADSPRPAIPLPVEVPRVVVVG